jgi:hypothetical protein
MLVNGSAEFTALHRQNFGNFQQSFHRRPGPLVAIDYQIQQKISECGDG